MSYCNCQVWTGANSPATLLTTTDTALRNWRILPPQDGGNDWSAVPQNPLCAQFNATNTVEGEWSYNNGNGGATLLQFDMQSESTVETWGTTRISLVFAPARTVTRQILNYELGNPNFNECITTGGTNWLGFNSRVESGTRTLGYNSIVTIDRLGGNAWGEKDALLAKLEEARGMRWGPKGAMLDEIIRLAGFYCQQATC